ncbi:helix-turn-helix domain-containing protein [Pseudonocardia sp. CA-142604]|uniref:helix-turn-helix domain-containing protein n=1 Tax=Pseudonocardia sp. CA-142604 TaxID=3240024 RepID=UPI003D89B524
MAEGPRRRTAGLRREEVAMLAGMSVDYVARLEQGRSSQPSTQLLGALARALRLSDDERDHLSTWPATSPRRPTGWPAWPAPACRACSTCSATPRPWCCPTWGRSSPRTAQPCC